MTYGINVAYWDTLQALDWAVDTARELSSPNVQGIADQLDIEDLAAELVSLGYGEIPLEQADLAIRVAARELGLERFRTADSVLEAFFTDREHRSVWAQLLDEAASGEAYGGVLVEFFDTVAKAADE